MMPSSFYRRHHHHHQHHYHNHSHLFNFIFIFIIVFIIKIYINCLHKNNPTACRRVLWILLVRRCTVCLGADFCPVPQSSSSLIVLFVLFVFIFCHDVLGSAHDSLNTRLVLNMLLSFPLFFPLFLLSLCLPPVFCVVSNVRYFI